MKKISLLIAFIISICSISYSQCTPSINLKADKSNVCIGEQVTFTATAVNGGTPTYVWSSSVYGVLSETTDTYIFTTKIQYEVISVKMTSSLGCASPSSVTQSINVSYYFNAGLIGNYQTICYNTIPSTITVASINTATTPIYSWEVSQTGIDGSFTLLQDETGSTYTPNLALTQDLYIRRLLVDQSAQAPCNSGYSNIVKITVTQPFLAGSITSDQTVCSNSLPKDLFESTPSNAVLPEYDWEESTDGITYNLMSVNSNTSYYDAFYQPYTSDIYIRRIVTDITRPSLCNTAISNSIKITIQPAIVPGIITGDESVCNGQTPSTINESIAPTGSLSTYYYQWQSDAMGFFYNITGATNNSYNPGYLSTTTSFRLIYGPCGNTSSNVITKTIKSNIPPIVFVNTNPSSTICAGTSVTFKATPTNGGTPTYTWHSSVNGFLIESTDTYTSSTLLDSEVITVTMISSLDCAVPKAASMANTMTVLSGSSLPTVTIAAGKTSICSGTPVTFYATASNVILKPSYEWFIESGGDQVSQGAPSLTDYFTTSALQPNDKVLVKIISNDACANHAPVSSTPLSITVSAGITAGTIGSDQTICSGTIAAAITELTASDAVSPSYIWEQSVDPALSAWVAANGNANGSGFIPQGMYTSDIYIRRVITDPSVPAACNVATASPVHITVVPCTPFSSAITGTTTITPGQQNVTYSVPNQTDFTYSWSITGGNIVSGQNTNSVTVDWDVSGASSTARTTTASYSVSVTETNQANESKTTTMELNTTTTATTLPFAQSRIQFYPNPAVDAFNIVMPQSGTLVQYTISDLTGTAVANGTFTSTGGAEKITANFNAGLYQVVLTYNETVTCIRLNKLQ